MKLEQVKQLDFASNASFENIKASISADDMHKLWDMLQNPYKNPIGAVVREYVSNSFDAHAEADFVKNNTLDQIREEYSVYKNIPDDEILALKEALKDFDNQAVRVTMGKDSTGWFWSTEDVGIGLSRERVFNIFANYLKSSKETSNTMIGAFGLGSKSGLSYSDVVFIRTRYLGTESLYLLRKGAEGPEIDIITNEPTEEVNGTEIKIYLNSSDDVRLFQKECEEQLCYFDNVFYTGCAVENDFKIVQGTHWIATTAGTPHYDLHLVLGKVSYPIDWKVLEIDPIYLNIGLKFEIGELDVIQTREDVKYTPRTKEAIKKKIELLKEELQERWDNTSKECSTIAEYYDKRDHYPELVFADGDIVLNLSNVGITKAGYYFKPFRDAGFTEEQLPNKFASLFFEYVISGKFISRFQKEDYDAGYIFDRSGNSGKHLYRIVGEHDPKKSKYIIQKENISAIYFIRKRGYKHKKLKKITVGLKWYKDYLKLKKVPKDLWRNQITVFRSEMEKFVISQTHSYDKVVIDPVWLQSQRKKREARDLTVVKMKRQNVGSYGHHVYETDERNTVASIEQLTRSRIIIGDGMDVFSIRLIHRVYNMFTNAHPSWIRSYEVAPTNVKKFKNVKNLTTVESFKEGKSAVFRKVMSTLKLYNKYKKEFEFLERYNSYRSGRETIDAVSPYTKKRLDAFQKIFKDFGHLMKERGNEFLRNECFEIAKEHNLWDFELEKELESCVMLCKSLKIINAFDYVNNNKDPETTKNTLAEFIYLKNRLDRDWVKVPLDIHRTINYNEKYQFCNKKETPINTNVKNILPV